MRLLAILVLLTISSAARADEQPAPAATTPAQAAPPVPKYVVPPPTPREAKLNAVSLAPIGSLAGQYALRYVRNFDEKRGISVQLWATIQDIASPEIGLTWKARNYEACTSYVWHLGEVPFEGPWLSAGFGGGLIDDTTDAGVLYIQKGIVLGPRAQAGYDWLSNYGIFFGVYIGAAYQYFIGTSSSSKPLQAPAPDGGLDLNGLLQLGYAW